MRSTRRRSPSSRGMSMVEVLVALAILVIAMLVAFLVYDASRKSFKKGENAAEQQQAVRIAFDQLNADLRMAGFNTNPDGSPTRPDEQIEAAFDTAVVVRADYDAEDSSRNADVEPGLAGGGFLTVSTGNDEIVAYVLAKPDGSSTGSLVFRADVGETQRDGDLETITIPNVALVQNDPPYTLYRITLNNNGGLLGTSSFFTRTPLVENVRSMTFRYYNQNGSQVNSTFDLTTATEDIGGLDTDVPKGQRSSIRRIGISLEGLTRDPDQAFVDAADADADTRHYRKFQLEGDVTPRNLGLKGIRDLQSDMTPPSKPATPTLVPGHCGGLMVIWAANPVADQVVSYRINYGLSSTSLSGVKTVAGTSAFVDGLTTGSTYYVSIQAVDAAGNMSIHSNQASAQVTNTNTPSMPAGVAASQNLEGSVRVSWNQVTTNTSSTSGDPQPLRIRDLKGYRVYRGGTATFTPATGSHIADENAVPASSDPFYPDGNTVNCRNYYYRVSAVDTCGVEGAKSASALGRAVSTIAPAAPANVQAHFTGMSKVTVAWAAVTQDTAETPHPTRIEHYTVWRSPAVPVSIDPGPLDFSTKACEVFAGELSCDDNGVGTLPTGYTYYYRVQAADDCPNLSDLSEAASPQCAFAGTVKFLSPVAGQPTAGPVNVTLAVVNGGTETYQGATITFTHSVNGVTEEVHFTPEDAVACPSGVVGTCWRYDWLAIPAGQYTLNGMVTNVEGCSAFDQIAVTAGNVATCCLSLVPASTITAKCVTGTQCKEVRYYVENNKCLTAAEVTQMTVEWIDNANKPDVTTFRTARFDGSDIAGGGAWTVTIVPGTKGAGSAPDTAGSGTATKSFSTTEYDPARSIPYDSTPTAGEATEIRYIFDLKNVQGTNRNVYTQNFFRFVLLDSANQPTDVFTECTFPTLTAE